MNAREHFLARPLDELLRPGESGDGFAETSRLLQRVAVEVPAYRRMLQERAIDEMGSFSDNIFLISLSIP